MTSLWNNFKIAAQLGEPEHVPPGTPAENIDALLQTARAWSPKD